MTIKSYQANKIDTFSDNYKKLFKQFVDIYTEMKRVPEPGSLIQVTREWEYPFAILNSMPKVGDVCLDLGGGASPLPLYLARKGCNITVIDIDSYDNNHSYNDNKLWGYHPQFTETNLSYIKSDFLVYDFGNKKYDKIYCIGVIEHLKEEEQIRIYNEITEVRSPLRGEYLDARFEKRKDELYLLSDHIVQSNNSLVPSAQEILHPETLMKDRVPGISLEDYIRNLTPQGLPRNDVKKGDLYYWYPKNECVVGFGAGSGWSGLVCVGSPQFSVSALGVRRKIFHRK